MPTNQNGTDAPEPNQTAQAPETDPDRLAPLKQITPLSKYLAMALFIILPFVGGYIGYQFGVEKVMTKELAVEKTENVSNTESEMNDAPRVSSVGSISKNVVSLTKTDLIKAEPRDKALTEIEIPSFYSVSFEYPEYMRLFHSTRGYYLQAQLSLPTEQFGMVRTFYVSVDKKGECRLELCAKESLLEVSLGDLDLQYLGENNVCLMHCGLLPEGLVDYMYRMYVGDLEVYIRTLEPIHENKVNELVTTPEILDLRDIVMSLNIISTQ